MFEIVDRMDSELDARFTNVQPILFSCDALNPRSPSFLQFAATKPLAEAYSFFGIDCSKLQAQCIVAKNTFADELETATVETVAKKLCDMTCAFPDLSKFAQVVLTIAVSSAGAERSFSTMKRLVQ